MGSYCYPTYGDDVWWITAPNITVSNAANFAAPQSLLELLLNGCWRQEEAKVLPNFISELALICQQRRLPRAVLPVDGIRGTVALQRCFFSP